eukprot:270611-Alexandrium_andersonii.AAC.1
MSASLVGSEMCIRDRRRRQDEEVLHGREGRHDRQGGGGSRGAPASTSDGRSCACQVAAALLHHGRGRRTGAARRRAS